VIIAPATATVAEGQPVAVDITAADPDGDAITSLTASMLPAGATFTPGPGNTSGTLSWTPDFSQAGSHTVTFTAGNALSGSGTTEVTVTNTDVAPVVTAPATATVAEGVLLTVNVTVADPDGDPISSLDVFNLPPEAEFVTDSDNSSGVLSWTPKYSQAGSYSVTFTAANTLTGSSTTTITVTNTDRPPVVSAPATATVAESGLLTVNVTAADPDGNPIASLTAANLPAGATFTPAPDNRSGSLSWTPDYFQAGSYSVTFTAANALSGSDATDITVTNVDRAPVVIAPAAVTVAEDQPLTVDVTAVDPDGEPITSLVAGVLPAGATFTPGPGNATGTLNWTPDFSQAGSHDITFTAANALSGSATTGVTVTNTDRAPVVTAPASVTVAENDLLTVEVTAADPDGDAIVSLTAGVLPAGATFTPGPGNTSGTLSWTPDFTQAGGHAITFTAANALSGSGTTDINVTNTDRAPVVTAPATASVAEGQLLTVSITAQDPDGDPIHYLAPADLPPGATFTPAPDRSSGTLSWTPGFSQAGIHPISFTASNALYGVGATVITVTNTDRAPVVTAPATASLAENEPLTVDVTAVDPDGEPITSLGAAVLPAGATFTPGPGNTSGTLTWTPDFFQAGSHTVTFTAANALSGAATTDITVANVDRAPVLTAPATASVAEGQPLTVDVTVVDPDGEPIASLTTSALPAGATFTPGPGNESGTLSWTPGFDQAGSHGVTFTAANALIASGTTAITVSNTDRAPVVTTPATADAAEGQLLVVSFTAVDPDGDPITSIGATGVPPGATLTSGPGNSSGTLTWTPSFTQAGNYSVTITASNLLAGSGTTAITVANTDRAPVVTAPATATVAENGLLSVNVAATDPDGAPITSLTAAGLPSGATFTPGPGNTNGTLSWTPDFFQAGSYDVTFTAANALSGSATTTITVTNVDRAPVLTAPATASVAEGQLLTVDVTVTDPDGEPITSLTAAVLPAGATFTPGPGNASGTLSWTPDYLQSGSYSVTFTGGNALSASGTTEITVVHTDRAPVITAPATATVAEGQLLTLNFTVADPDGEPILSLGAAGLPAGAAFTSGEGYESGTLTWTPDFSQTGSYSVTFTASNALLGSATTVITVTNSDRAPVVTAPATASVAENGLLTVDVTASDPDGEPITSLTAAVLPSGATFVPGPGNTTGTLSWTPDYSQAGNYPVSFTASNALSGSATTDITVTGTDRAPVVTAPDTVSVAEDAPLAVNVTAADPDGDPLTSFTATGLPAGATFTPGPDNSSGTLSWTPGFAQAGTYPVSFTASNALSGSDGLIITVVDSDRAPVVTAPAAVAVAEGDSLTVEVTALDPDGDAISSLAAADLPEGASFTPGPDNAGGTLRWTPGFSQAGSYSVRFTAANALSGADTTEITVANTVGVPVVTAPAAVAVAEGDSLTVLVTAVVASGDPIDSLTVSGLPPGAVFTASPDNTAGVLAWEPGAGDAGTHVVVFTAHNGHAASDTTVITVTAPTADAPGVVAGRLTPRVVPNPIRHSGQLRFTLSKEGALRVDVFDLSGRLIGTPMNEAHAKAGMYEVPLGSTAWNGPQLSSGLYFFRIQGPDGTSRGRFMVRR
jgi:protocatechuate 3,4-dioxygenase beta subunit